MAITVLDIAYFALIALSYALVLQSLMVVILHSYFIFKNIIYSGDLIDDIFGRLPGTTGFYYGLAARLLVSILFIIGFYFELRKWEGLMLWQSPIMTGVVFAVSAFHYYLFGNSSVPYIRFTSNLSIVLLLPALILIGIFSIGAGMIADEIYKWGVVTAGGLIILEGILSIPLSVGGDVKRYQGLVERRNSVKESFEDLEDITIVINNSKVRGEIEDALEIVSDRYRQSGEALKNNDLEPADILLLQAEKEIEEIENIFQNRVSLSLRDELEARIDQAKRDIDDLKDEFEAADVEGSEFDYLREDINDLQNELDSADLSSIDITSSELTNLIEEFDEVFNDIQDIRTSLRFYRNANSTLDELKIDVKNNWEQYQIAKHLGLSDDNIEEMKDEIDEKLHKFENESIESPTALVVNFHLLQQKVAKFDSNISSLSIRIKNEWTTDTVVSDQIQVFVPKTCKTSVPTRAAVVCRDWDGIDPINFVVEGTNIEVPSERKRTLDPQSEAPYINHFDIAGKKGWKGTLSFKFNNQNIVKEYNMPIISTIREIGQRSFWFSTPIAGLSILLLWSAIYPLQKAGPIGIAVGSVFGIVLFIIDYTRQRQSYTLDS